LQIWGYDSLYQEFNIADSVRELAAVACAKAESSNIIGDNDSAVLFCGLGGEVVLLSEYA
jgi:hypothetical protein